MCNGISLLSTLFRNELVKVHIRTTIGKGRSLFSNQYLRKGEIICEKLLPFAISSRNFEAKGKCTLCLRDESSLCLLCNDPESSTLTQKLKEINHIQSTDLTSFHRIIRKLAFRSSFELSEGYANTLVLLQHLSYPLIEKKQQQIMISQMRVAIDVLRSDLNKLLHKDVTAFFNDEWYCLVFGVLNLNVIRHSQRPSHGPSFSG